MRCLSQNCYGVLACRNLCVCVASAVMCFCDQKWLTTEVCLSAKWDPPLAEASVNKSPTWSIAYEDAHAEHIASDSHHRFLVDGHLVYHILSNGVRHVILPKGGGAEAHQQSVLKSVKVRRPAGPPDWFRTAGHNV